MVVDMCSTGTLIKLVASANFARTMPVLCNCADIPHIWRFKSPFVLGAQSYIGQGSSSLAFGFARTPRETKCCTPLSAAVVITLRSCGEATCPIDMGPM